MEITKGKWTIDFGSGGTVTYLKAGKTIIAEINTLEDGIDNVARLAEAKANAYLIAAAPDLLAACELVLLNLTPMYSREHLCIKTLEAAIAAASDT